MVRPVGHRRTNHVFSERIASPVGLRRCPDQLFEHGASRKAGLPTTTIVAAPNRWCARSAQSSRTEARHQTPRTYRTVTKFLHCLTELNSHARTCSGIRPAEGSFSPPAVSIAVRAGRVRGVQPPSVVPPIVDLVDAVHAARCRQKEPQPPPDVSCSRLEIIREGGAM